MQITSTGKEFDESRVYIGWRGENRAEQIEFVMPRFYAGTDLLETDCVLELWSKDGYYDEIPLTLEGDTEARALWEPTLSVMSHVGDLYGRLSFVIGEGNVVLKTSQVNFYVRDARDIDGQIEKEYPTELQSLRMRVSAFEAALADGSLKGEQGEPGVIFTPAVSNGILSWSNDGGLPNPDTVSIKGPQGDRGPQGEQGPKGDKGDKGERGEKGAPFVYEDFTADQIEALKVKGDKGDKGDQGDQGERGAYFTPYVQDDGTLTWRNNGGYANPPDKNIIGPQGEQGIQGEPGPKGEKGDKGEVGATGPAVVPSVDTDGIMSFALQDTPVLPDPVSVRGPQGDTGAVPNITVGTVSTLPPGSSATVTRQEGSTNENPVLDFGLPAGRDGEGSGDMVAAVYDPTNKAQDIFAYTDQAEEDAKAASVSKAGDTMTGVLNMGNNRITGIADATEMTDAVSMAMMENVLTQLPYIPNAQKGTANGVASLDATGKVPAAQLPPMNYDPAGSSAEVQSNLDAHSGNTSNPHSVTAAQVGAVPTAEKGVAGGVATLDGNGKIVAAQMPDTGGSAEEVQAHLDEHIADTVKHVTADERTNWNSKAAGDHTHTAAQVGARPEDWLPTAAEINAVPTNRTVNGQALSADISLTAADVDSIPASEKEAAGGVPALDSTGKILPKHIGATSSSGTDYSTPRLRNIRAGIEDMTAGTSALNSGEIYLVYE